MATNETVVSADRFAVALDGILAGIAHDIDAKMPGAVLKTAQAAKRYTIRNAKAIGVRNIGGKTMTTYIGGFSYRTSKKGRESFAEVGNKTYPGLVHLLEKGHALMGGGRSNAYEHVGTAADEAFKKLEEYVEKAVEEAL